MAEIPGSLTLVQYFISVYFVDLDLFTLGKGGG